ncbi:stage II sporulation protein M [Streptomyces diastaticus]
MAATGRLDPLLCVLVPQGLLELTAVFLAVGTGLRPGWTVTEPGRARRGRLLALRVRGGRPSRPTQPHRGPPGCRGRRQGLLGHLMCIRQPRAGSLLTALEKPLTRSGQGGRLEQLPGSWLQSRWRRCKSSHFSTRIADPCEEVADSSEWTAGQAGEIPLIGSEPPKGKSEAETRRSNRKGTEEIGRERV